MRLKADPDDFMVREATDLRIRKQPAAFRVYMLEKRDWNTADALMRIARDKRVPYDRFAYGGKKDRHAHTFQYVTVQYPADLSLTAKGYSLQQLGFSPDPMGPAHIFANRFELTVRDLKAPEAERLRAGMERVRERGVINYFDDQRFGNVDAERGYVAEKMLQGRWEEALAIALTAIYPEEKSEAKQRKRTLRERWGDWQQCREVAHTALEQRAFDLLVRSPGSFREALATVHKETAGLWIAAYQSHLWNEVVRRLLTRRGLVAAQHPGADGPYLFPTPDAMAALQELVLPLPGQGMRFSDPETGLILEEVLLERRMRPLQLERELLPGLGFRASPRPVLVVPQSVWTEGPAPDERYPGQQKLLLRFTLPRGAYATMVVKAAMA